jgi:hypothetical protein
MVDPIRSRVRAGQLHPLPDLVVIQIQAGGVKAVPEALPEDHTAILPTQVVAVTAAVADLHPQAQGVLPAVAVLQDRTEEDSFNRL